MQQRQQEQRPNPDALLEKIAKENRGKLTVFLGAAAGVVLHVCSPSTATFYARVTPASVSRCVDDCSDVVARPWVCLSFNPQSSTPVPISPIDTSTGPTATGLPQYEGAAAKAKSKDHGLFAEIVKVESELEVGAVVCTRAQL